MGCPGKWKHGPPAVCPSYLISSHPDGLSFVMKSASCRSGTKPCDFLNVGLVWTGPNPELRPGSVLCELNQYDPSLESKVSV